MVLQWLLRHPETWDSIVRVALLHPDIPAGEFPSGNVPIISCKGVCEDFGKQCTPILNQIEPNFMAFAKTKVSVYDTKLDFATTIAVDIGLVINAVMLCDQIR